MRGVLLQAKDTPQISDHGMVLCPPPSKTLKSWNLDTEVASYANTPSNPFSDLMLFSSATPSSGF